MATTSSRPTPGGKQGQGITPKKGGGPVKPGEAAPNAARAASTKKK